VGNHSKHGLLYALHSARRVARFTLAWD